MKGYPGLKQFLLEFAEWLGVVYTINEKEPYKIVRIDRESVHVRTEKSNNDFIGDESDSSTLVAKDWILGSFDILANQGTCSQSDLKDYSRGSSFLMALLAALPFTELDEDEYPVTIRLKRLTTQDLPEGYNDSMGFLKDEGSEIKKKILRTPFFNIVYVMLGCMEDRDNHQKKETLLEMMYLVVRSSTSGTPIKESVAERRLTNTLRWLEKMELIDSQLNSIHPELVNPIEGIFGDLKYGGSHYEMEEKLRSLILHIINQYVQARHEEIESHDLVDIVTKQLPNLVKNLSFLDANQYAVKGSVGLGNWAFVPWLAIMHKDVTTSTQRGYYIVYLFSEKMDRLYLTIAQGITETSRKEMALIKENMRNSINMSNVKEDNELYLGESKKARDYAESTIAYIPYSFDSMPSDEKLQTDLQKMIRYYEKFISGYQEENNDLAKPELTLFNSDQQAIDHIYKYIASKGFYYKKNDVVNLYLSLKTKPFVILSGISGTGKTKIIQWFAESLGAAEENGQFTLIPVRPDWSDGSDLLGYVDIKGDFQGKPLTKALRAAHENLDKPYFVLLDEMNLARVEYYFSDLLSVMESRKWEDRKIATSSVLPEEDLGDVLTIPPNVYFIGTVNMDETTHPFSKKVLDRANTIEFNDVKLDHFDFLEDAVETIDAVNVANQQLAAQFLHMQDAYHAHRDIIHRVTNELVKVNEILQKAHFQVGYRVRDEVCFYMIYNEAAAFMDFDQAFDFQLHQKVLPRLAGSDAGVEDVLKALYQYCSGAFYDPAGIDEGLVEGRFPKSTRKLVDMLGRLDYDGFTSFWQ